MSIQFHSVFGNCSSRVFCGGCSGRSRYADSVKVSFGINRETFLTILFRSVDVGSRSLSMGLQGMAISLFGTLPSSIIWGLVIDTACRVWDKTCNGANGSCSIYDSDHLRIWMHLLYVGVRFISLLSDIYVWKNAGNLKIMDDPVADVSKDCAIKVCNRYVAEYRSSFKPR